MSNPKMIELLKSCGMWYKEGDKVVMGQEHDDNEMGTIDFVHTDDMISVKFGERYELLFHDQIRRPHKWELESNKRIWKIPQMFDYSDVACFDD